VSSSLSMRVRVLFLTVGGLVASPLRPITLHGINVVGGSMQHVAATNMGGSSSLSVPLIGDVASSSLEAGSSSARSTPSCAPGSSTSPLDPVLPTAPPRTRLQDGIRKPKQYTHLHLVSLITCRRLCLVYIGRLPSMMSMLR
jgi:hypothetical protein